MISLDEHNKRLQAQHEQTRKSMEPHGNGIECPKCKSELWDSNPSITLSSNPPQKNTHCPKCDYRGYRVC